MLTRELLERFARTASEKVLASAAQGGFDTSKLWFHGTRKRFNGFRLGARGIDELGPGVYLTDQKWLANTWAREGGLIAICVVRRGPLFDLESVGRPEVIEMMRAAYIRKSIEEWVGKIPDDAAEYSGTYFDELLVGRDPKRVINRCLHLMGYIGAFKHHSQIEGQIVVFQPSDVMIVARQPGARYMSPWDNEDGH
jgi:hypothetical protein